MKGEQSASWSYPKLHTYLPKYLSLNDGIRYQVWPVK